MPTVERAKVLAYRTVTNQLHERADVDPVDLGILDLGVPNVPAGSARQALAARTSRFDGDLVLVWATRGAPHLHRAADLPALAEALWPVSDADAAARFASRQIPDGAALGTAAFQATAEAFLATVDRPTAKGDASRAVSDRVPAALTYNCGVCESRHISGSVFQQAGLAGGVRLDETATKTVLLPVDGRRPAPAGPGDPGPLIRAYLRLLGPATLSDVAKYLGTSVTALRPAWPVDGLAEVRVSGRTEARGDGRTEARGDGSGEARGDGSGEARKAWLLEECLDALLGAEPVRGVRLLPPSDPFLQARDRALLTPDKAREKEVWRILGNPGVLLLDGDLAGTWRARVAGKRLAVTVTTWTPLPGPALTAVEAEAQWVAAARGLPTADVTVERGDT